MHSGYSNKKYVPSNVFIFLLNVDIIPCLLLYILSSAFWMCDIRIFRLLVHVDLGMKVGSECCL